MPWQWPWNRQQTPSAPSENGHATPPAAALSSEKPLSVEARLSRMEATLETLHLDWQEVLDKIGRWGSRQAARERRRVVRDLDELTDGGISHEDAPGMTNGGEDGVEVAPASNATLRAAQKAQLRRLIPPRGR